MRLREHIEDLETRHLAPYAMKSRDSAGRAFPEPPHEVRTCYQRDRDRIVHSQAFRKLEYKTQVFVIFEGDYYRTRLTHTLEVAQIARTIGRSLGLNEDLIEAVALAHDLGHPPFGHAGEAVLNEIMDAEAGLRFDHNQHSFDIVTRFEKRYPDFDGLNLTKEVLVGILKHATPYDRPGEEGYHPFIDEGPTLEARVVDKADSLAYLTHDVDDGLTSGCITEADLTGSALWQKVCRHVARQARIDAPQVRKYQLIKTLLDMQIKDFLTTSIQRLKACSFRSADDVKKSDRKDILGFSATMCQERDELQHLLYEKLYHHYRVERMTSKARRIIKDLFKVYKKNPRQLPYAVYSRERRYDPEETVRTLCHYIASMTDRFALDEHKKLFDPYEKV